jgi:mannose-6-phosphate isomerase-like protein (cupin superfamily)
MDYISYQNIHPFDFYGLRIRDFTAGTQASMSIAEIEAPPGIRHQTARSNKSDKLYYCLEGDAAFRVGEKELVLHPGDVLIIRKGEWFDYESAGNITARLLLIHVPPFDGNYEEFKTKTE